MAARHPTEPIPAGIANGAVGIKEATMHTAIPSPAPSRQAPWNKGRLTGQKRPLKPKDVWAIRSTLRSTASSAAAIYSAFCWAFRLNLMMPPRLP